MPCLTDFDIDLLRLLLSPFWQTDLQNTVLKFSSDLRLVHRRGNTEGAQEFSARSFRSMLSRLRDRASNGLSWGAGVAGVVILALMIWKPGA